MHLSVVKIILAVTKFLGDKRINKALQKPSTIFLYQKLA